MIAVRERADKIELENTQLRLAVAAHPLAAELESGEGRITGLFPRAVCSGRPFVALRTSHRTVEKRGENGEALRLTLEAETEAGVELCWSFELEEGAAGVTVDLCARNRAIRPTAIDLLEPVVWSQERGALALPGDERQRRFFQLGYQSWSPAGFPRISDPDPRPRHALARTVLCGPLTPSAPRGVHVCDYVTSLRSPGCAALTLGFLTHDRFLTHLWMRHRGSGIRELAARTSCEGRVLGPGESLAAERLWLGLDPPRDDGIASWAERAGREMRARVAARVPSGWSSWYRYFRGVRAEHVRANLRELERLDCGIEVVQIDDGYQAAAGDWARFDPAFPEGVAPLAREIRGAGFQAGLWLAPLLVSRTSDTAKRHPKWILRDGRGEPRIAYANRSWAGKLCYALDPTHPGVLEFLRELARTVRGWGFDYLKLDFLYAGALRGRRHQAWASSAEAYRRALTAIREGAGEDAFLLGCGAPLGPSIGLFDAMRIGPDVAPFWRSRARDLRSGLRSAPAAENSIRNILARAALHRRLWLNDPDCLLARDRDTKLGEREVRTLAGAIGVSGGLVVDSDDLCALGPERRALIRRLCPAQAQAPELGQVRSEIPERAWSRQEDGSLLLFAWNPGVRTRSLEIEPRELGLKGPLFVYDVWEDRLLGSYQGQISAGRLRARESALLRLVPRDGSARLIGSTLHLGNAGFRLTTQQGSLRLELRLPGSRQGRLILDPGRGPLLPLRVGFRNTVSLEVQSRREGVEEPGGIPDR